MAVLVSWSMIVCFGSNCRSTLACHGTPLSRDFRHLPSSVRGHPLEPFILCAGNVTIWLLTCALASLQQHTWPPPSLGSSQISTARRPPRRPESRLHICVNWNRGTCRLPICAYRHICAKCQLNHEARDCPDTPSDSHYKTIGTAGLPNGLSLATSKKVGI